MGSLMILDTDDYGPPPMVTWEKWDAINLVVLHTFNQTLNRAPPFTQDTQNQKNQKDRVKQYTRQRSKY